MSVIDSVHHYCLIVKAVFGTDRSFAMLQLVRRTGFCRVLFLFAWNINSDIVRGWSDWQPATSDCIHAALCLSP